MNKILNIVTHRYTVIISFFMILINGQAFGGFFLLYLLFGLPYGAIHSLLSVLGIGLLLFRHHKYKKKQESITEPSMEIFAVILLLLSLFLFFYNDKQHYNYGTFYQLVPLIMLILFLIIALACIVRNAIAIYKISLRNSSIHHINS